MPIILMKFITNKYVIVGLLALALFGYVKYLNTSLTEARKEAQGYAAIAKDKTLLLEALGKSYDKERKLVQELSEKKQQVVVKVEERVKTITKLEKVYVQDSAGCRLDDTAFGLLTDAYKDANESRQPTK